MHVAQLFLARRIALERARQHRRVDHARTHTVDADAVAAIFRSGGLGQADHRVLAGGIDRLRRRAHQARHRCRIDDRPAALLEHLADLVLHAQPRALDVDVDDAVEQRFLGVGQRQVLFLDAGVVKGAVEAAEIRHRLVDQRFNFGRARDVGLHEQRLATGFDDHRRRRMAAVDRGIGHHHAGAGAAEGKRGRAANPARRPRHQHDLALERGISLLLVPDHHHALHY